MYTLKLYLLTSLCFPGHGKTLFSQVLADFQCNTSLFLPVCFSVFLSHETLRRDEDMAFLKFTPSE
jgi:hypothetical protein